MITEVFELNDVSDEETFYPIGIFLSLQDAIDAVEKCEDPWNLPDEEHEEYVAFEIRKRAIGLSGHGLKVWKAEWKEVYSAYGEQHWERIQSPDLTT